MSKAAALKNLEDEMASDLLLPLCGEANLVFGEGNIDCKVMFIGEAPGANEDRLKRPFVGRAGQLLDTMIRELGWKREDVYITNIVKRRPPENRDPLPSEIGAYQPYLTRQIEIIKPKLIVTLGRFSMHYFIPEAKMTRDHGHPLLIGAQKQVVFPVYHPAAALRSKRMMETLYTDFKKIPDVLAGKLVPEG
jgi:DNA polymerase